MYGRMWVERRPLQEIGEVRHLQAGVVAVAGGQGRRSHGESRHVWARVEVPW